MKKFLSFYFIFIFCIAFISGCSCEKSNLITYRNFYDTDVSTFNYMITNEYQDIIRIANLVDGLVENDKYGNIVPSIAKSWKHEMIGNKQVYTFYLKNNVYWSDYKGNKYGVVTANDFVTSLKYSLNYNTKSNNYRLAGNLLENGMNYYNATLIKNFDYDQLLSKIALLEKEGNNTELAYYKEILSIFDYCLSSNKCNSNFDSVGIKAINDFELQFTLEKPVPYFLSALTYYAFLPANEKFIKEIGFNNFGTNKKTLLYNGAYLLNEYSHSSRMEFIKNPNYWDKENVFIDKLIFTKSLNYSSDSFARLSYESNNIDEFVVSKDDNVGWQKYVTGKENTGDEFNPIGDNTFVSDELSNFTTYYLIFNQERTYTNSTLKEKEITIANTALANENFRKALMYGMNKQIYFNNEQNTALTSIVPKGFITYNNSDYYSYLLNEYSTKNNISLKETETLFSIDPFFDSNKSSNYLNLALKELNLSQNDLPIKLEFSYFYNTDYITYDKQRITQWNKILNGCKENENCKYDKIEIVYNTNVNSINGLNSAFYNKEYHITFLGLYPDFNDPTTYLQAFGSKGELYKYLNHSETEYVDDMLHKIDSYYEESNLAKRYTLCSELEYYLIFEKALLLPLSLKGANHQIVVSNLIPYQKMNANYGLSPFKFKFRKIRTKNYTQEDIKKLKEENEKGVQND